ncbi:MAG: hypothetical protein MUE40_21175, partial [Anaerolineae bacterium]|nr:hypothetical protein [Anaerolineae bacterium]
YGILPPDQMETAAAAGIRFMRFPGGSIFDEDGRSVPNYLVDLFMLAVRQLNVEPSIQVKLFEGTPQEAADLVTYVNITKGYNVRYWYIGNEPNLYPDDYSVADLNAQWRPVPG